MAFITYLDDDGPDPELSEAIAALRDPQSGVTDNIMRISGHNLPVLKAHEQLYRAVMYGKSPLTRPQREMVALVVSAINECHY